MKNLLIRRWGWYNRRVERAAESGRRRAERKEGTNRSEELKEGLAPLYSSPV
jgi:hypothetical protein